MRVPTKTLQWWGCLALAAGAVGLDLGSLLAWLSLALLLLAALKLAEARSAGERRLVALLQLLIAGLLAGQRPELLPSLGQLLAVALALAGLLQLESGQGQGLLALLRRSLALLLAVLPLALVLFLATPRLGPLWPAAPGLNGQALTGLASELDPGSIADLARDDSPAARVSFSGGQPPAPGQRTWRVLVHPRFDGARWLPADPPLPRFRPPLPAPGPSQLWLVEPSLQQAMPWDGQSLPATAGPLIDSAGELLVQRPAASRRSLLLVADAQADRWRRVPPGPAERAWPEGANPRLEALGRSWRSRPPAQRLAAARELLGSGRYRYTLQPGRLPERAGLDVLLFERRAGFCGHYASALAALMRAAGVPARVVSGYQGGTWVPLLTGGGYLELRQSDAHAWSELWLDGRWQSVDPSAWVLPDAASLAGPAVAGLPARLLAQWWGVELAWSRWWIGFDQGAQRALLRRLLGEQLPLLGWILVLALVGWMLLVWRAGRWPRPDPLARALRRWRRLGITPLPGETLPRLVERVARQRPELADQARQLARRHQRRQYGPPGCES